MIGVPKTLRVLYNPGQCLSEKPLTKKLLTGEPLINTPLIRKRRSAAGAAAMA